MEGLSYISTPRITPYQIVSLVDLFKENAETFPDKEIAIYIKPGYIRESLTYSDLLESSMKIATYLVKNGTMVGDHVGLYGPNSLEWIVGEIAIIMSGAVSVHLSFDVKDTNHMRDFLANSKCKVMILDTGDNNQRRDVIESVMALCDKSLNDHVKCEDLPSIIFMRQYTSRQKINEFPFFENILNTTNVNPDILPTEINPFATVMVFPTSGCTGRSKWIKHTHCSLINANNSNDTSRHTKIYNDRPFPWTSGHPTIKICTGKTVVFSDALLALKPENASLILSMIKEENCTDAFFSPSFLKDTTRIKDKFLDSNWRLNFIVTSGKLVRSSETEVIGKFCNRMLIVYGISEMNKISAKLLSKPQEFESGSAGVTCPGTEVKVVSSDRDILERGNLGMIFCRRAYMFQGYLNREDLTSASVTPDGWFNTGDLGIINKEGEIIIKGRVTETISRGMRDIVPSIVEDVIINMPLINKVAVIAVPDKRLYEEVCVCYVTDDNVLISPEDLEGYCRGRFFVNDFDDGLSDMPTYFLQFNALPMLPVGTKPDLQELKCLAKEKLGLADENA